MLGVQFNEHREEALVCRCVLRSKRITKWRRQLASATPALASTMLVFGWTLTEAGEALAGSCVETPPASGAFVCSGPLNTTTDVESKIFNNPNRDTNIATSPGFGLDSSVNSPFGDGIEVLSASNVRIVDANASPIVSAKNGISFLTSSQDTAVGWSGRVTATKNGIEILGSDGSIAISTGGRINAGITGIAAFHVGLPGDISITANEQVTAGTGSGIWVLNATPGQSSTRIVANAGVSSTFGNGIEVRHEYQLPHSADLSISTIGDVTGGLSGVVTFHEGTGPITIDTTGAVTGNDGHGIFYF